jgi:hypothetical protein
MTSGDMKVEMEDNFQEEVRSFQMCLLPSAFGTCPFDCS